jgi:hypothetical protein
MDQHILNVGEKKFMAHLSVAFSFSRFTRHLVRVHVSVTLLLLIFSRHSVNFRFQSFTFRRCFSLGKINAKKELP